MFPSIQTLTPSNFTIKYCYRFKAYPIDILIINNDLIPESENCTSSSDNLDCLEANSTLELHPSQVGNCPANNVTVLLSYGYDNESEYLEALNIKPLIFNYN